MKNHYPSNEEMVVDAARTAAHKAQMLALSSELEIARSQGSAALQAYLPVHNAQVLAICTNYHHTEATFSTEKPVTNPATKGISTFSFAAAPEFCSMFTATREHHCVKSPELTAKQPVRRLAKTIPYLDLGLFIG